MDLQTILTAVESWPAEDRLRLIERIRDGLSAPPQEDHLTEAQEMDLQRRLDEYRDDPKAGSIWDVVKTRLQMGGNPVLELGPRRVVELPRG